MLTLYVRNIKTVRGVANYEYIVMSDAEKIAEGTVKGHRRKDGWRPLVKKIVEQEAGR
jgi:hypothetical protein